LSVDYGLGRVEIEESPGLVQSRDMFEGIRSQRCVLDSSVIELLNKVPDQKQQKQHNSEPDNLYWFSEMKIET